MERSSEHCFKITTQFACDTESLRGNSAQFVGSVCYPCRHLFGIGWGLFSQTEHVQSAFVVGVCWGSVNITVIFLKFKTQRTACLSVRSELAFSLL